MRPDVYFPALFNKSLEINFNFQVEKAILTSENLVKNQKIFVNWNSIDCELNNNYAPIRSNYYFNALKKNKK